MSAILLKQFCGKKQEFMATDSNKQKLIWMLSDELRKRGCTVDNATIGDADVLIIKDRPVTRPI